MQHSMGFNPTDWVRDSMATGICENSWSGCGVRRGERAGRGTSILENRIDGGTTGEANAAVEEGTQTIMSVCGAAHARRLPGRESNG